MNGQEDQSPEADECPDLPGHVRPLGWFESAVRRGCTDEYAI